MINEGQQIVYKATSPSGKVYIGITSLTLEERIKSHFKHAKYKNYRFYKALRKYDQLMNWEILETTPDKYSAIYLETYYIKFFNSFNPNFGYNSTLGGEGFRGRKHSQETVNKIKMVNKANPLFKKLGKKNKELYKDPAQRKKLSEGVKLSFKNNPKRRKFYSDLLKKTKANNLKASRKIKIRLYNEKESYVFDSIKEALIAFNADGTSFRNALKNKTKLKKRFFVEKV